MLNIHPDAISSSLDDQSRACMKLWAAVLALAAREIDEAIRYGDESARAIYWMNDETIDRPGSFVWICDLFGIHPNRVRAAFRRRAAGPKPRGRAR